MDNYLFHYLYTSEGWKQNQYVQVNKRGIITCISEQPTNGLQYKKSGIFLPGFINAHSHVFQYAMAGIPEIISEKTDNFWSWRTKMYELALKVMPKQLRAIAEMAYAEMLRNGYTHVVEFHYLHLQLNGKPYSDPAEMSLQLMKAADNVGIGLTIIPIFYQKGGFGKDIEPYQKRFYSANVQDYEKLLSSVKKYVKYYDNCYLGYGVHSLRATELKELNEVYALFSSLPFHIHISEQSSEVNDCVRFHGKPPLKILSENIDLNDHCHLVHCTHFNDEELEILMENKANVVLCPSTEGNLGDGFFSFRKYINNKGNWCIGSDSHVGLSPIEELRWLDYGQRLIHQKRDTVKSGGEFMGEVLYKQSLYGGLSAAGLGGVAGFREGDPFSGILLDDRNPQLAASSKEYIFNSLIYHGDSTMIKEVWVRGKKVVKKGKHKNHKEITKNYVDVIKEFELR